MESSYQNSDLNVPEATDKSTNLYTAELRGMTWKKSYKNEHDLSNRFNLS